QPIVSEKTMGVENRIPPLAPPVPKIIVKNVELLHNQINRRSWFDDRSDGCAHRHAAIVVNRLGLEDVGSRSHRKRNYEWRSRDDAQRSIAGEEFDAGD